MLDLLAFKPPADVIGGKWKMLILKCSIITVAFT